MSLCLAGFFICLCYSFFCLVGFEVVCLLLLLLSLRIFVGNFSFHFVLLFCAGLVLNYYLSAIISGL